MYELIQRRPWIFPLFLAPVPFVISLLGIAVAQGFATTVRLIVQPAQVEVVSPSPWSIILRPALISGLLVGLFAWLAAALPNSAVLKRRKMTQKRAATALASFLAAGAMWSGIVLGDIAWRLALFGSDGLQEVASLENSPWIYLMAVLVTAALFYGLVRPRARPRMRI
jgi:hypothetical protein